MGLRFSVFGFSQEKVVGMCAVSGGKEIRLDVTDLLILTEVADFPNRNSVLKIIEDEKIFFWVAYSEILAELPILNLKKRALRDRFDKLVMLGLLEKHVNKANSMTFFRLTDKYETLRYGIAVQGTDEGCMKNDGGRYLNTQGVGSKLPTTSEINTSELYKEKEIYKEKEGEAATMPTLVENKLTAPRNKNVTSEEATQTFEELWMLYERKGNKQIAKNEFAKLNPTEEEIAKMRMHIPAYIEAQPEKKYRLDFERYIKRRTFDSVVYSKDNALLYDPDAEIQQRTTDADIKAPVNDSFYR
jgi:hypothetical protein